MSSSAAQVVPHGDGYVDDHDHVLRPRPRKPLHSQVSQLSQHSNGDTLVDGDGSTVMAESLGLSSGQNSGRSTPLPEDAPPSVKHLSSARQQARAQQRRLNRRRIFPTVEFATRVSHFDPESDYRDFHGFFNLFWIGLAIMGITTMLRNMKDTGYPMRVQIWSLFTVKLWHLAVADALMVASTAVSLPLHKWFRRVPEGSFWSWKKGGSAVQGLYQAVWLGVWIMVPFWLEWMWTAQVFLLLHTMVLLMKMHSWAFYNGHLCETEKRLRRLDGPDDHGELEPAYLYPTSGEVGESHAAVPSGVDTDSVGAASGAVAGASAVGRGMTRRRSSRYAAALAKKKNEALKEEGEKAGTEEDEETLDELMLLREDLAGELTSPMGNVTYPSNLTWSNYLDYLLCPTLCYELEYPRVPRVHLVPLVSKIIATFGCIFLLTIISEEYILPILLDASSKLEAPGLSLSERALILAESVSWLLFPFMLTFLLVFLVIFEYVLGAFAEITRFADRHFYSDWWNSTDWMEFSREWNIPVYSFLRRHVYSASRPHTGKHAATLITFLISAVGHEIVMACITKKVRGYGFFAQMLQLPIVMLQRARWVRSKHTANNVMFWISMILGLSSICALYVLL